MLQGKARRTDFSGRGGRPDGVIYRQQYIRCGKIGCRRCPPAGPGHGPYWYGYYWDYQQHTRSFYVGKQLPSGVELVTDSSPALDVDAASTALDAFNTEDAPIANASEVIHRPRDRRPSGQMPPC
jgi:hypothetical protein